MQLKDDILKIAEDNDPNWQTFEGETPMLIAIKYNKWEIEVYRIVETLLQYGANPCIKDNEDETPLLAG